MIFFLKCDQERAGFAYRAVFAGADSSVTIVSIRQADVSGAMSVMAVISKVAFLFIRV